MEGGRRRSGPEAAAAVATAWGRWSREGVLAAWHCSGGDYGGDDTIACGGGNSGGGSTIACNGGGDGGGSSNDDVLVVAARSGGGSGGDSGWTPSSTLREQPLERGGTHLFSQIMARVCGGRGPFSSYRAQDGPRGERAHLRPTTLKPKMIIKILKDPQRGEMEINEGPLNTYGPIKFKTTK